MKNIAVLGSTGSIGTNTLRIAARFPDRFAVKALAAKSNIKLLASQIGKFRPAMAAVFDEPGARNLEKLLGAGCGTVVVWGDEGYREAASLAGVDTVVTAMVGAAGLLPTMAAIEAGKNIALANKETLVMAGDLVSAMAARKGVAILPVDSEHSAIFQSMHGQRREDLHKIFLTASGGPFYGKPAAEFGTITREEALAHPTWRMGPKISIDSATLMNKGLEVIEASCLFGVSQDRIEVLVHRQSIVHSMVAYRDGSIIAQLGVPDMQGAIAYALSFPERLNLDLPLPDFAALGALTFDPPNFDKFPCLALAYDACRTGHTLPAVLNAANETAVTAFLEGQIAFLQIPDIIRQTMDRHSLVPAPAMTDILAADQWARQTARRMVRDRGYAAR